MTTLIAFEDQKIRRQWHNEEWYFSVTDIVAVLTDSTNARRYWSDLKRKIGDEQGTNELYEKIVQLKLPSADGKRYVTDCANPETMLRLIQSIPSPKAEPFKLWLAQTSEIISLEDAEHCFGMIFASDARLVEKDGETYLFETKVHVTKIDNVKVFIHINEHAPPHFHVSYSEFEATFSIETGEFLKGNLPQRELRIIKEHYPRFKRKVIDLWNTTRPSNCPVGSVPL